MTQGKTVCKDPMFQNPGDNVPQLFFRSVSAHPQKIAVKAQTCSYTYAELDRASSLIADFTYRLLGDKPRPVALFLENGAQTIAALLGVLRTGHFYSILSPKNPPARSREILNDLQTPLLITSPSLIQIAREAAAQGCRVIAFDDALKGDNPAFYREVSGDAHAAVYYTSGSTGEPKGILRSHSLVVRRGLIEVQKQDIRPDYQFLLCYALSSTATLSTIFGALFSGASLHIYDAENTGIAALKDIILQEKITYLRIPVELLRYFLDSLPADSFFSSIRHIGSAGDVIYFSDLERLRPRVRKDAWFITQLGMSEFGTITMNRLRLDQAFGEGIVPLGRPLPGKEIIILDEPTRGLDQLTKNALLELLLEWNQNGKTILLVTHEVEFAAAFASRILILEDGQIVSQGDPRKIMRTHPRYTPQIARLYPDTDWLTLNDLPT